METVQHTHFDQGTKNGILEVICQFGQNAQSDTFVPRKLSKAHHGPREFLSGCAPVLFFAARMVCAARLCSVAFVRRNMPTQALCCTYRLPWTDCLNRNFSLSP